MAYEPPNYTIVPTAENLAMNRFAREKVAAQKIETLWRPVPFTVASLAGVAAGAPPVQELGTSGLCNIFMDTDADAAALLWLIPPECDVTKAIDFRVLWSSSQAAATGSCLWQIKYRVIPAAGATSMGAPAATVLDTLIVNQADLGEDIPRWTSWGSIAANKAGVCTLTAGDDLMQVDVVSQTQTTITDADFISAQVRYYVRMI